MAAVAGLLVGVGALNAWGQDAPVNLTPRNPGQMPTQRPVETRPAQPPPVDVTPRPGVGEIGLPGTAGDLDGLSYPVSGFVLKYAQDTQGLPMLDYVSRIEVELGKVPDGYVAPREGVPTVRMRISEAADRGVERYYASAIATINRAILAEFNRQGVIAVLVTPSDEDIRQPEDRGEPDWGRDLRPAGRTDLTILIKVGIVREVRTLANGDRIDASDRVNNSLHRRIRVNSPIQPVTDEASAGRRDLVRRDLLDDYLFRLNRHPGRHVDASLGPSEEAGGVVLDYLVSENRPWTVYAQISNTGTEATNEWRERFGFLNNQLLGNDDIFSVDYITAGFEDSHALLASYEAPFFGSERVRYRLYGSWDQYTASDVGQEGQNFNGRNWGLGGDLIYNIYQRGELFVDVLAGARWSHVKVDNELVDITGETDFFLPSLGIRAERQTEAMSTFGSLRFEFQLPDVAGTERDQLDALGRLDTDEHWTTMKWDISHSMYLEPLLFPTAFRDPQSGAARLANELAFSFRGQFAFDYRLIPNEEQVVGGMYTVRGYPESVVAGDTVIVASAEYRFHLPRALGLQPDPSQTELFGEPFRWTPQQPYGRADWDFVLKAFVDGGQTYNSDPQPYERDRTLLGAGVGAELQFKRNLSVRLDWGMALKEVPGEVSDGSSRVHFSATILF